MMLATVRVADWWRKEAASDGSEPPHADLLAALHTFVIDHRL